MRTPSATELLSAWEQALPRPPLERPLTLLAACSAEAPDSLARLSVGERDARLLALREQVFGAQSVCLAACPACGEYSEFTLDTRELRAAPDAEPAEALTLRAGEYEATFRLPNSLDLLALAPHGGREAGRRRLLTRCVLSARRGGEEKSADELPAEVLDAIAERMAEADPQADVGLRLTCPRCEHGWREVFDICSFLWRELDAWARRLLGEVHALARAYGWREADILAMSPLRRQLYLNMVTG